MVYRRGRYIQVDDQSFFHKVPPNKVKMLHFQIVGLVLLPSTKVKGLKSSLFFRRLRRRVKIWSSNHKRKYLITHLLHDLRVRPEYLSRSLLVIQCDNVTCATPHDIPEDPYLMQEQVFVQLIQMVSRPVDHQFESHLE